MRGQGTSALVIEVPEVEDLVGPFRQRYDPVAPLGMPPHITILFPFVDVDDINEELLAVLWKRYSQVPAFSFRLPRLGQFGDVLFLAPEPREPFDRLIAATREWYPQYPPYGGAVDEPDPHLTVAHSEDPEELARICGEVEGSMSAEVIESEVSEVALMTHERGKWRRRQVFPLAEAPAPPGEEVSDDEPPEE